MGRDAQEIWAKRVERWRDSGLTAKEFAAETGLNAGTLAYWRWRLGQGERRQVGGTSARPAKSAVTFVEVAAATPPSSGAMLAAAAATDDAVIEVVLGNGIRIRVPAAFDASALERVVAVVGGR